MDTPTRRRSRLFHLEDEVYFLDESPHFREDLGLIAAVRVPSTVVEVEEDAEVLELGDHDHDPGSVVLSVVVEEDHTMASIRPRPLSLTPPAREAPLRWELVLLVAVVYLAVLGGFLWW